MKYLNTETQEVLTDSEIRKRHLNVSFPRSFPESVFAYKKIQSTAKPSVNDLLYEVSEGSPEVRSDGTVRQTWVVSEWPLDVAKSNMRSTANLQRDILEADGFDYLGKRIDSSPESVRRISMAAEAAKLAIDSGQEFFVSWTCADNSQLPLDGAGMVGMVSAAAKQGMALHARAKTIKYQIDSATSISELEAIDIGVGLNP